MGSESRSSALGEVRPHRLGRRPTRGQAPAGKGAAPCVVLGRRWVPANPGPRPSAPLPGFAGTPPDGGRSKRRHPRSPWPKPGPFQGRPGSDLALRRLPKPDVAALGQEPTRPTMVQRGCWALGGRGHPCSEPLAVPARSTFRAAGRAWKARPDNGDVAARRRTDLSNARLAAESIGTRGFAHLPRLASDVLPASGPDRTRGGEGVSVDRRRSPHALTRGSLPLNHCDPLPKQQGSARDPVNAGNPWPSHESDCSRDFGKTTCGC